MGALCEDLSKIMISCQIFLRIQQQDDNSCAEEHILCLIIFFPKIMPVCDNVEKYVGAQMSI